MSWVGRIHEHGIHRRRIRRLAQLLAECIPVSGTVLDVGCGDGRLSAAIGELRTDLRMEGIDVLVRPETAIAVTPFDGRHIRYPQASRDVVMMVDVLHHADDPTELLSEAARVARHAVVIKDHARTGFLAQATLRFMDWIGNAHHGVALPYNYWTAEQWSQAIHVSNLEVVAWATRLHLFRVPATWLFDRSLHFVAVLKPRRSDPEPDL